MKKWLQNLSSAVVASLLAITLNGKAYANFEEHLPSVEAPLQIEESASANDPVPAQTPPAVAEVVPLFEPAPESAVTEPAPAAPAAVPEAPAATPEAAETISEAPEAEQVAVHETPAVMGTVADEGKTVLEISVTDAVITGAPEDIPAKASDPLANPSVAEEEMIIELVNPAVKEEVQPPADEKNPDTVGQSGQEATESNSPSDVLTKLEASKIVSQTKVETPDDLVKATIGNAFSVQENTEETDVEGQPEEHLEEQIKGTAKKGTATEESINEERKATATRGTGGENTDTQTNQNGVFSQNSDGSYVLVNHSGTEALSANGDITVLAAGLNRIGSISGNGTVTIAGTGILLVDNLQGNLNLLTFTDIYDEGSVAVFVKQEDGTYLLKNGSVPGILDEEYTVKGVTLVMPEQTSLHLIGTGAAPKADNSVLYYHGTDHGYFANSGELQGIFSDDVIETTGKLTIAQQAALIVKKGASIILENLKSLGGTDYHDGTRHPELVVDGGTLTVNGTVGNGGDVILSSQNQALFGEGSVTADKIIIQNAAVIENSQVSFSSQQLYLNGEQSYENLIIHNSVVHPWKGIDISGLTSSGNSTVALQEGSDLNIKKVEGALSVKGSSTEHSFTGDMKGSGTINFESGIYALPVGTKLNNVTVSSDSMGTIFDYAGELNKSFVPLHIGPEEVKTPGQNSGLVPVAAAGLSYDEDYLREYTVFSEKSITATKADDDSWVLKQEDIQSLIDEYRNTNNCDWGVDVQILRMNQNAFSLSTYSMVTPGPASNSSILIPADNLCLIRIIFLKEAKGVAPDSPGTQTGTLFTGSGILGGSGAGSVNIGRPGGNGNTNVNPTPTPTPVPVPEPDPVPLVAIVEEAPEEAPLIWAKVVPAATNDAGSSTETQYVLLALEGEKTLKELGGQATVAMNYTPPEEYVGKPLYVVFRDENNKLVAFRATYSNITGLLRFITDRLGTFMIVGFDFDVTDIPEGEDFPPEFYEALAQLPELKNLFFTETGVI